MKIANSSMMMTSNRIYEETRQEGVFYGNRNRIGGFPEKDDSGTAFPNLVIKNKNIRQIDSPASSLYRVQNSLLQLLIDRLRGVGAFQFMSTGQQPFFGSGSGSGSQTIYSYYEENESVSFETRGIVTTEDGRTIDFGVNLEMSRSFVQYASVNIPDITASLTDPLVINLDTPIAGISDQKFLFDLDCDGIEEEISTLNGGSGFLALDLNGDGKINDGSELFGTASGNGFADLAKYDADHNGWIDENDPIFSRLKVWTKGADGKDILMSLKDADVGAICLNAADTEFSMKNTSNTLNGVVRKTGVFLKESGGVGTVQHIDLAARKNRMLEAYGA